jgi:26S proteasome regulatory subunit T1
VLRRCTVSRLFTGIKESDTGLAQPSLWDLVADKQKLGEPLQVARCTTIVDADTAAPKYMISIEHQGRYVVELGDKVAPTDIEEGMRVGIERVRGGCWWLV